MFCGSCGTLIKEGGKFCPACGWAVPVAAVQAAVMPTEKRCASCGTVLKDGAKFCPNCGCAVPALADVPAPVSSESVPAPETTGGDTPEPKKSGAIDMEYFISINNQESGPFSLGQLQSMIRNGQINLNYWVCRQGSDTWTKIDETPELSAFFGGQPLLIDTNRKSRHRKSRHRRLRHGFTSFWLWLSIIVYAIGALILLLDFFMDGELLISQYPNVTDSGIWIIRIGCIIDFYAFIKLLKWEKSGFWLLIAVTVISIFLNPYGASGEELLALIIIQAVSLGILFGVLQFKNAYNAKSTWEQLE